MYLLGIVFQSRAWGLAATVNNQQVNDRDFSPMLTQAPSACQCRSCNSFEVISPPWVPVPKKQKGDIDFLAPARSPHFHFDLKPTNYGAGPEWKTCKTQTVVVIK